jgi:hypothetical protein
MWKVWRKQTLKKGEILLNRVTLKPALALSSLRARQRGTFHVLILLRFSAFKACLSCKNLQHSDVMPPYQTGVAGWHIFVSKSTFWVPIFWRTLEWKILVYFVGHLVCSRPFGVLCCHWVYSFHVLVSCTKKNLAIMYQTVVLNGNWSLNIEEECTIKKGPSCKPMQDRTYIVDVYTIS